MIAGVPDIVMTEAFVPIAVRDGGQAFRARGDFMHTPLVIKAFHGAVHVSPRELFNDGLQLGIALSHDLVEMRGADSRFLELMVGPTGVNGFMAELTDMLPQAVRLCRDGYE